MTMGSGDVDATSTALSLAEEVIASSLMLPYLGWREIAALSCVCKSFNERLLGHDTTGSWKALCENFAREKGLYAPSRSHDWKALFWDMLWPSRGKWLGADSAANGQGFKINVAVRFRPARDDNEDVGRDFVLPLHQRLKLLQKGEQLSMASAGVGGDQVIRLLNGSGDDGGEIPPEVLAALQEAGQLAHVAARAEEEAARANGSRRGRFDASGDDLPGANGQGDDQEGLSGVPDALARVQVADGEGVAGGQQNGRGRGGTGDDDDDSEEGSSHWRGMSRKCGAPRVLALSPSRVVMFVPGVGIRPFQYGRVFRPDASQLDVFDALRGTVLAAVNGFNAALLCYGQTGSGKTHTLYGPTGALDDVAERARSRQRYLEHAAADVSQAPPPLPDSVGLVLRMIEELFVAADALAARDGTRTTVTMQYVEVYQERISDLLGGGRKVILRERSGDEGGDYIAAAGRDARSYRPRAPRFVLQGALEAPICCLGDAVERLGDGEKLKRFAATAMNERSSRAHTVLVLHIVQTSQGGGVGPMPEGGGDEDMFEGGAGGGRVTGGRASQDDGEERGGGERVAGVPVDGRHGGHVDYGDADPGHGRHGGPIHGGHGGPIHGGHAGDPAHALGGHAHGEPAQDGDVKRGHGVGEGASAGRHRPPVCVRSELTLVDLAGCEHLKLSKVRAGEQLRETISINSSLLVLGKCITALVEERQHVPYYESTLTQLLRGAFGGNSRTTAVITAASDPRFAEHTLQALRFGEKCAAITNVASLEALSLGAARGAIEDALATCREGLRSLEARGKTRLPAYLMLRERYQQLSQKRAALFG